MEESRTAYVCHVFRSRTAYVCYKSHILSQDPYTFSKHPCVLTKEPYIFLKEPCILDDVSYLETRMRYFGMCVTHIYTHVYMCVTHIYTHIAICRKEGVSLQNEEEGENAL